MEGSSVRSKRRCRFCGDHFPIRYLQSCEEMPLEQ
jgi:hypothetical protein